MSFLYVTSKIDKLGSTVKAIYVKHLILFLLAEEVEEVVAAVGEDEEGFKEVGVAVPEVEEGGVEDVVRDTQKNNWTIS